MDFLEVQWSELLQVSSAGGVGSIPGLGRSPGGRAWQPTLVFSPGEFPRTEEPGGLQSTGLQSCT